MSTQKFIHFKLWFLLFLLVVCRHSYCMDSTSNGNPFFEEYASKYQQIFNDVEENSPEDNQYKIDKLLDNSKIAKQYPIFSSAIYTRLFLKVLFFSRRNYDTGFRNFVFSWIEYFKRKGFFLADFISPCLFLSDDNSSVCKDFDNDWGLVGLSSNNSIWFEDSYKEDILDLATGPSRSAYAGRGRKEINAKKEFLRYMAQLTSVEFEILQFFDSGSNANSHAMTLAKASRKFQDHPDWKKAKVLFLDGMYGGGSGISGSMNWHNRSDYKFMSHVYGEDMSENVIPIATEHCFVSLNDEGMCDFQYCDEVHDLLKPLEERLANPKDGELIGAIFVEPILASKGVCFFHPFYWMRLRELADKYGIVIIADEIFTGGGRTGKMFSFEHYPELKPDFFTFGKALQVSGVARVKRVLKYEDTPDLSEGKKLIAKSHEKFADLNYNDRLFFGFSTNNGPAMEIRKGVQVLKGIKEQQILERIRLNSTLIQKTLANLFLLESTGEELGQYKPSELTHDYLISGIGFMWGSITKSRYFKLPDLEGAERYRYIPPLDFKMEHLLVYLSESIGRRD